MRAFETLRTELQAGVLTLTLHRPERLNAVDGTMHRELAEVYAAIAAEPEVRAVVVTGSGRAFCAGGDLQWLRSWYANTAAIHTVMQEGRKIIEDLLRLEMPVIAAVNGDAVGLGATLALFCDIIYAAESARFGDPHVRVGLVAGDGGAVIWPLLIGLARAKELLLTGDLIPAVEAERLGLINRVLPVADVVPAAQALARRLADSPLYAIRGTKRALNKRLIEETNRLLDLSLWLEAESAQVPDFLEATTAFLERRPPKFGAPGTPAP